MDGGEVNSCFAPAAGKRRENTRPLKVMVPLMLLFICSWIPGGQSMYINTDINITQSTNAQLLTNSTLGNNNNQTNSFPTPLKYSGRTVRATDEAYIENPSIAEFRETVDVNVLLRRSYAEARAGCSNMSSAEVLKGHVEKLRGTANGKVDLVFLVDSSSSVGITNFFNELKFVRKLLAGFEVAEWATRVAVITFASRHRVVVNIDHLSEPNVTKHKCSLLGAELPSITYVGGGTFTRGAFVLAEKVLTSQWARPNATKAVFLITDGYSNGGDPRPIAQNLIRNHGVEIFTFGIENGNVKELRAMASEPKLHHCYILDSFEEFEALARRALHEDLHLGDFILENEGLCSSLCPRGGYCCHPEATCRCGTTTGQYECICPQGYHGSGLVDGCHLCPPGTYKPQAMPGGISTCKSCPDPNHTSRPGSISLADCTCRNGYQEEVGTHVCRMVKCPALSPPTNGFFVSGKCISMVHNACAMGCSAGFKLIGRPIRECFENATWSGEPVVCKVKTCPSLPKIPNGSVHCTKEGFVFDAECTTLCDRGFVLVGSKMRRCLPIAMWDGLPSACRAVTCPSVESIPHASLLPRTCSSERQTFGTECRTVCDPGYRLADEREDTRLCLASGSWDQKANRPNVCLDVTTPDILCPDDIKIDANPNDNVANVSWNDPLTLDNSGEVPSVTVTPSVRSPWLFTIGETFITYFATDRAGNSGSCSFVITVMDSQPPVIERCHSPGVVLSSDQDTHVAWEEPQFSDNSGRPVTVSRSHNPGLSMSWGTTRVEYVASDSTGNTKSCHITVNVQQSACIMPDSPQGGRADCVNSNGGIECSLGCDDGYAFPIEPESIYSCSGDGRWSPNHGMPWEDCAKKENPDNATQPVVFGFPVNNCDQELADQMAANIRISQDKKEGSICNGPVDCRFAGVKVSCRPKGIGGLDGSLIIGSSSPRSERQQLRGDIDLSRQPFEKLKSLPSVYVEMNITGTVKLPDDVTSVDDDTYQDFRRSLSSASNSILETILEDGNLPPGMGTTPDTNSIIVFPTQPIPVCRPGNIQLGLSQCLECAAGTFFNDVTKECERCPQGSYQSQPGQMECVTCPPDTSTVSTRSKSLQECKDVCSQGSHSDTGLEQCEPCPKGTYQPYSGSLDCIPCPDGTSTLKTGSISLAECTEPCKSGYVSRSGLLPCLPCPDGYYQPGISKTSCFKCLGMMANSAVTTWESCIGTSLDGFNISSLEVVQFNDCFSIPCSNGATCEAVSAGYVCICEPGYTGIRCDIEINECENSPCENDGKCVDGLNGFTCVCKPGFAGETCSVDIDECRPYSCENEGRCIDGIASYQCDCTQGYYGEYCEEEVNECLSNPCYNGAYCVDSLASFSCDCLAGFDGSFCEMEINECMSEPCLNGAECHDLIADYRCDCKPGFVGTHCQTDVDECVSSPCRHGGSCLDDISGYLCVCQHGYTGPLCEVELPWDFSLVFDHFSTTDYILMKGLLPEMMEVSASFWMRTTDSFNYGSPFSYGAMDSHGTALSNAFTFMDYSGFVLYVNDSSHVSDVAANDGMWHHIAVTWASRNGRWVIYKDGWVADSGEGLAEGAVIPGGGIFVVGQEQDSIGGDFASSEAFVGEIALLHVWNRTLSSQEISALVRNCERLLGQMGDVVLAWPDTLFDMYGEIRQVKNHFCEGCYAQSPPEFGDYTGFQSHTPLNVITFSCETGFELKDSSNNQAVCQISGDWLPYNPPQCQRKKCWHPGNIQNGEILGTDTKFFFGSQVKYVCYDGYTLVGPHTRDCYETGVWSDYQPSCEVVVCGAVPEVPHSTLYSPMKGSHFSTETSIVYHCQDGYRLRGQATVICQSDGTWSELPDCLLIQCSKPEIVIHASLTPPMEDFVLGGVIRYDCVDGYQLVGSATRTCQLNGTWSGASPSCIPFSCGPPPAFPFSTYTLTGLTLGSVARYSCMEGYEMMGNASLVCAGNFKWEGEYVGCTPRLCPEVEQIAHGVTTGNLFFYGESLTFECDVGYRLNGVTLIRCLATGQWSDRVPACEPVSCGSPDTILNGNLEGSEFEYGGMVRYQCHNGYYLIGSASLSCDSDGQWSGSTPSCSRVECGPPPRIPNADLLPADENVTYFYQTNVTVHCHIGYSLLDGSDIITCGSDGSWQGEVSVCQPVSCDRLGGLINGRLIRSGHSYNDTATYICEEGFYLVGRATRICQASGRWSGIASSCFPVLCPPLPLVPNAKFSVKIPVNESAVPRDTYSYRTKVRYRCDLGYQTSADFQELRCNASAQWSAQPPSCRPIRCPDLSAISHGTISGNDLTFNSSVVYTCDKGYQLFRKPVRTCLADGTWSGVEPVCKIINCGKPDSPENGRFRGYDFTYQRIATFACNQGYRLEGAPTISCQSNGQWSMTSPRCNPVDCGSPPHINLTTHQSDSTTFGSLAYYACLEGYEADRSLFIQCGWDAHWVGMSLIHCSPMLCDDAPVMEFGSATGNNYHVGDTAMYSCIEGAVLHGNGTIICQPDRTWTDLTAFCRLITCSELAAPNHGAVNAPRRNNGSFATFTCDDGYNIIGDENITCMESGDWSGEPSECEPVTCPMPDIANGQAVFVGHRFTDEVIYRCDSGYQLVGVAVQHCSANGDWSAGRPVCQAISCGVPVLIKDGYSTQVEVVFGDDVRYSCKTGYRLQGSDTRSCMSNGELSGEEPVCEIISCPEPRAINNAGTPATNRTFGSLVTYDCIEGFHTDDSTTIECLSNGSWSQTVIRCNPVSCGLPGDIENGDYSLDNGATFREEVVYHCHDGHELEGIASQVCQSNGAWGQPYPTCEPISCGPPPEIENGDVQLTHETYLSNAVYACEIGYDLVGINAITCLSNRSWSYSDIHCVPVSCGEPEEITNGHWTGERFTIGDRLSHECDIGHDLVGMPERVCQASGEWSGPTPTCQPIKCPPPPEVQNGVVLTRGDLQYRSEIQYRCDTGHVPSTSETSRICQADGTWSGRDISCVPVSCGPLPSVDNAYIPLSPSLTFDTLVAYRCHDGYQLQGIPNVKCLEGGLWSLPRFQCSPVSCGDPGDVLNGEVYFTSTTFKSVAVYSCSEGFRPHGATIRHCLANQLWSEAPPLCRPVPCGRPPSLPNAVHVADDNTQTMEDYVYGAVTRYTCVEGYEMASGETVVCQANGKWNSSDLICKIKQCPPPEAVKNGQVLGEAYTYSSTIQYVCDAGFELSSSHNLTCLADQMWHPSTPTCWRISCPEITPPPQTTILGDGHLYEDVITFHCQNELQLRGSRQLRCTSDGTWDQLIPTCAPRSCGRPPNLEFGIIFGHSYQPGDTISYRCSSGYLLNGPSGRRCLPDFRWSGQDLKCVELNLSSALNQSPVCIFPCLHGGTCRGPYQCSCPYGYAGSRCEIELCTSRCIGSSRCTQRHPSCK
ncbi:sushi, von Willebrand factor type A, EGF and pentraxin domain-containing protein 1-like isoform X1 [Asterias rubens]|uniref:sushi, von Willebrand factor type A, EGF and pentraxin domain-containing protein 1-like isoform X1 n=2 Tax=Asterias rubens TaxID=7604 RepID=UPI001454E571|nr:sushi, von Willebrand factor type A, EGF and pentraxin domain-containing protein 1-like isoform X1 [Asterias rubens]